MYVITGATGHTGRLITEKLLKAGQKVTAVSRGQEKVAPLEKQGAVAALGNLKDTEFLINTFQDAMAVYALIPPDPQAINFREYQHEISESIGEALEESDVKYVITLSSFGAQMEHGTGVVEGLYEFEQRINAIENINALHLRAGFFMENLFSGIEIIQNMDINGGFPIAGNIPLPMVHAKDIAEVAYQYLLSPDFEGKELMEVAGNKDYSLDEATAIIGKAIGKPDLEYVQFDYEDAKKGMIDMGFSESLADQYIQFSKSVNEGTLYEGYMRTNGNTTPTPLEEFVEKEFVPAYKKAQKAKSK